MKVAVSLPTHLFEQADDAAARLGLNRSQFYARALSEILRSLGDDPVTARLDQLAELMTPTDTSSAARRLVDAGAWEW